MKLIMKTEFERLSSNVKHHHETNKNGDKHVLKIYCDDVLIAKKITLKKSIRFFGIKGYEHYLA